MLFYNVDLPRCDDKIMFCQLLHSLTLYESVAARVCGAVAVGMRGAVAIAMHGMAAV